MKINKTYCNLKNIVESGVIKHPITKKISERYLSQSPHEGYNTTGNHKPVACQR
jgi:hypothetical protein